LWPLAASTKLCSHTVRASGDGSVFPHSALEA
jgi:hypothetical protein